MNLYCADTGSKRISTAQTLAPNKSLLRRLWLQTNLYCADSDSKRISTAQTLAPNESLLRRLWLQTNLYCTDSGSKRISTAQTGWCFGLWLCAHVECVCVALLVLTCLVGGVSELFNGFDNYLVNRLVTTCVINGLSLPACRWFGRKGRSGRV